MKLSKKAQEKADKKKNEMSLDDQVYWSQLLAKHGSDYHAMQMDHKLNTNQCGAEQCKKMCEKYMKLYTAPAVKHA